MFRFVSLYSVHFVSHYSKFRFVALRCVSFRSLVYFVAFRNISFRFVSFVSFRSLVQPHYNTMIRTFCILKKMAFSAFHYLTLSVRCEELDAHIN
jgi:hypothetical protein